jgi:hypothetical protein
MGVSREIEGLDAALTGAPARVSSLRLLAVMEAV